MRILEHMFSDIARGKMIRFAKFLLVNVMSVQERSCGEEYFRKKGEFGMVKSERGNTP